MNAGKNAQSSSDKKSIHAYPTKDFFVDMITRDISLQGCIFDLLDNSIDGARRALGDAASDSLDSFYARVQISSTEFSITDNCGGIRLSDAIDYAFHFGRRPDSPTDVSGGIGLYGIGMKRAIFKIGRKTIVTSEADDACFRVYVDVDKWKHEEDNWDFDYEDTERRGELGTMFVVTKLYEGVAASFRDKEFRNVLIRTIAQDYAYFISRGFRIFVGDTLVPSYSYQLRASSDIVPAVDAYEDDDVSIRLAAGLIDDLADDIPSELRPKDVSRFGWFVICNSRVVLAADKSHRTVWGTDGYQVWHPQYNGFAGFAFFEAKDQRKLPWTTTKRDLDESHPLYRRAVSRMKRITDEFIDYTNRRKADLDNAKLIESGTQQVDVANLVVPQKAILPKLGDGYKKSYTTISYRKPNVELERIRRHIGRPTIPSKDIGLLSYDYYWKAELGNE